MMYELFGMIERRGKWFKKELVGGNMFGLHSYFGFWRQIIWDWFFQVCNVSFPCLAGPTCVVNVLRKLDITV